jgi:4a-hydroxytetrahydrobiopterin dehydratase
LANGEREIKMENTCLIHKKCVPCQGGVPPLEDAVSQQLLAQLGEGWHITDKGHLKKTYIFNDFMGPMTYANKIALLAEQEAHHPDLTIAWGRCSVEIWTHKINGLTESDFILAAKIEALPGGLA